MQNNERNVDDVIWSLDNDSRYELLKCFYEMPFDVRLSIVMCEKIFSTTNITRTRDFPSGFLNSTSHVILKFNTLKKILPEIYTKSIYSCIERPSYSLYSLSSSVDAMEKIFIKILDDDICNNEVWNILFDFFIVYLTQKRLGVCTFYKLLGDPAMYDIFLSSERYPEKILSEYSLLTGAQEKMLSMETYYASLGLTAVPEKGIFNILNKYNIQRVGVLLESVENNISRVSNIVTDTLVKDNVGSVNIFGSNIFPIGKISSIKSAILGLGKDTIYEFLPRKMQDIGIDFNVSPEIKMFLQNELRSDICSAQVIRDKTFDHVTLISYDNTPFLLFSKVGERDAVYGISLTSENESMKQIIRINMDSDVSYTLVFDMDF